MSDEFELALKSVEEEYRLRTLLSYRVLDSAPEADFDGIVRVASLVCGAPAASICFADRDRLWFKSAVGWSPVETARGSSPCDLVVTGRAALYIQDTRENPQTSSLTMVRDSPNVRAYFGVPLLTRHGVVLGALSVCDFSPRELSDAQTRTLEILASQVVRLLELRRSNGDMEASTSRLKSLIDNIGGAVMAEDAQRQILFVNESFRRMMNLPLTEHDLVGVHSLGVQMSVSKSFPDPEGFLAKGQYMISRQKPVLHEVLEARDGRIFERDYLPIFADHKYEGHIWVYREITERVQTERTVEKQRLQMVSAAKMSALGVMASGIAHEINNPLTIIRGNLQILLKTADAGSLDLAQVRSVAERVNKTTGRIAKIVSSLRAISRDGENDAFISAQLKTIIEDTLEVCQTRFQHHGIELRVTGLDASMTLECRPVQISQILLNLLNNAFDAVSSLSERWVAVTLEVSDSHYQIQVTDSGKGIPREIRDHLMQPFFTTKPVGKGTGLGLSLARTMAESHHGTLTLDPAHPNTCFTLRLPKRQGVRSTQ